MRDEVQLYDYLSAGKGELEMQISEMFEEWNRSIDISFHTSGSTGAAKEIYFTQDQIRKSAALTARTFNLPVDSTALLCLPLVYVAGKMMVLRCIINDWKLHYTRPRKTPLDKLNQPIDFCALTPMQLQQTLKTTPEKLDLIRILLIGGGPISTELSNKIIERQLNVYHSYGMTETLTHVALKQVAQDENYYNALSTIKFASTKENALKVLAPHISNNWIETNDHVELHSDTSFRWLGRMDNVINSGGIKISPETIETKLQKLLPFDFFIQGFDHVEYGTAIEMVLDNVAEFSISDLKLHFHSCLRKYERPKRIVLAQIYRTESGKIKRNAYKVCKIIEL